MAMARTKMMMMRTCWFLHSPQNQKRKFRPLFGSSIFIYSSLELFLIFFLALPVKILMRFYCVVSIWKRSENKDGTKRRRIARISSSSSDDGAYDVDTDVDEGLTPVPAPTTNHTNDSCISDSESNHHHNKYNDFFNSKLFFLHPSQPLDGDQRNEIEQIIQRHKG